MKKHSDAWTQAVEILLCTINITKSELRMSPQRKSLKLTIVMYNFLSITCSIQCLDYTSVYNLDDILPDLGTGDALPSHLVDCNLHQLYECVYKLTSFYIIRQRFFFYFLDNNVGINRRIPEAIFWLYKLDRFLS
jgi:hypothetical protein